MQDEWGATYWTYDAMGRPTVRHDPRGTITYYAYGDRGNRTQLAVYGQGTVYYRYDAAGRMVHVHDGKTGAWTYYEYEPAGKVRLQHHPNAATTYFSYDSAGRLSEKVTRKDADGSALVRFAYTRDAAGNPIKIERESGLGTFYYDYDALQRLSYEGQFVNNTPYYENYYEYDPAGNRSLLRHGETGADNLTYYTYDAANELTDLHDKDGWTYFAYDANGNTIKEQTPTYTRYFDYDGRDMLASVKSREGGWTDNEIRYDGLAMRASMVDSRGTTYYTWDGIRVLTTRAGDGSLKHRQVHGNSPVPSVGDIALMEILGVSYVPDADQVGTLWQVLDGSGNLANSYAYDAFGVSRSVTEAVANPFRYGGKPLDADPALYHFIARQYDAILARFLTRDPLRRLGLVNPYLYVSNRPVTKTDPSGSVEACWKSVSGYRRVLVYDKVAISATQSMNPEEVRGANLVLLTIQAIPDAYAILSPDAITKLGWLLKVSSYLPRFTLANLDKLVKGGNQFIWVKTQCQECTCRFFLWRWLVKGPRYVWRDVGEHKWYLCHGPWDGIADLSWVEWVVNAASQDNSIYGLTEEHKDKVIDWCVQRIADQAFIDCLTLPRAP